jgi:putative hydrolase of the HAD superfamily
MKKLEYEQIIFDLGGVLIDIDYQATEKAFIDLGFEDFGEKYSQLNQNDLFDKLEIGEISAQHFINKILPLCPEGTSPNKVVAAWNAMLGEFPKEKIELLHRVKSCLPIYMLSNTNEIHIPKVYEAWDKVSDKPMSALFDKIYLSFEIGKRKPDVSTFNWVCETLAINPSTTLFIDDSPQHLKTADMLGLKTHLLTADETLESYLFDSGILSK